MSCDLLAFDPAVVDDAGLNAWWTLQQWREDDATSSPLVDGFVRELSPQTSVGRSTASVAPPR